MKKTILVTGANGFVGSHILEAMLQREDVHVIAACRQPERLPDTFSGEILQGDLRNPAYRKQIVSGVDVICHAAAWTSAWGHRELSDKFFYTPSVGLINDAVDAGVSRFVFLSSTSAAAPTQDSDPLRPGDEKRLRLWPHLRNVVRIEQHMQRLSGRGTGMVNLRVGLFAGRRYSLGLLPLLTPRLKTHLVPWVDKGRTGMPIVAGEDIGAAFALAATADIEADFEALHIIGPEIPTVRDVLTFLHREYGLPLPHFSVPFPAAYRFARLMEWLDPLVAWEPLVTRSIIHLLEETGASNEKARAVLGYAPQVGWRAAIHMQMAEMAQRQQGAMSMARPLEG